MSTLRRYSGKADFKLRRYSVLSVQIWVWYSSAGSLQNSETLRRLPGFLAEIALKVYSVQGQNRSFFAGPLARTLKAGPGRRGRDRATGTGPPGPPGPGHRDRATGTGSGPRPVTGRSPGRGHRAGTGQGLREHATSWSRKRLYKAL